MRRFAGGWAEAMNDCVWAASFVINRARQLRFRVSLHGPELALGDTLELAWGTPPRRTFSAFERPGQGGLRNRASSSNGKGDAYRHCQGRSPVNEAAEAYDLRDSLQQR